MSKKLRKATEEGQAAGRAPGGGIGAADAVFAALADMKTAAFIKTVFSQPEKRPAVTTEKARRRLGRKRIWEVAIIEKPPAPPELKTPLLNVAHLLIDAADGRVRERWFLTKIQDDEYRDFLRARFPRPEGCKDRIP
jgi:hypothetical protein